MNRLQNSNEQFMPDFKVGFSADSKEEFVSHSVSVVLSFQGMFGQKSCLLKSRDNEAMQLCVLKILTRFL